MSHREITRFDTLAEQLAALAEPPNLIAIDGPGGAGKSTFARRLHAAIDAPTTLLHTDEFARPDQPTQWWPRLKSVISLLEGGSPATFTPFDWATRTLASEVTVAPTNLIIVEGVSASRREWQEALAFRIWLDAPASVCRARGTERDGVSEEAWDAEAAAEAVFFARDRARARADLIVDAAPKASFEKETSFAVMS